MAVIPNRGKISKNFSLRICPGYIGISDPKTLDL